MHITKSHHPDMDSGLLSFPFFYDVRQDEQKRRCLLTPYGTASFLLL